MSKQKSYNQVSKLYELIVKEKSFDISLSELINKYKKEDENEIVIINEISKLLAKNGYVIISIHPLKVKHK